MDSKIRLDHELIAIEAEHTVHAMLEVIAPPGPSDAERAPLSLALVIDCSGSMSGPKLDTTKACAKFLAKRLGPRDRLAIVEYDDTVRLFAPLEPVHAAVVAAIDAIRAGGMTNLSGGWLKGHEVLASAGAGANDGTGPRKVLLLTDGQANVGVVDHDSLVAMTRNAQAAGVGTSTIGFGDDFAEDLLTAMADAGGGNSYYAATPEDAPGIFATECEGLLSVVAQNVSVEIRPAEQVQMVGALNEYPQLGVPGGIQIALGDAYGAERRRVVFELFVPELASLGPVKLAEIVLRYVSVGEQIAQHEVTIPVVANLVSADEAATAVPDAEVIEEVVVLKAARAQQQARDLADSGEFGKAQELLDEAIVELRRIAPGSPKADELLDQATLSETYMRRMSSAAYSPQVRKEMTYDSRQQQRRRRPPEDEPGPEPGVDTP
jgi:Ca-activated chloride channel family protein